MEMDGNLHTHYVLEVMKHGHPKKYRLRYFGKKGKNVKLYKKVFVTEPEVNYKKCTQLFNLFISKQGCFRHL